MGQLDMLSGQLLSIGDHFRESALAENHGRLRVKLDGKKELF
jgi:hypothetical protein